MAFSNEKKIVDEISENIINTLTDLIFIKGINNVTVRDILKKLDITNRVFYNRFQNIEEVFGILYHRLIDTTRKCVEETKYDGISDYCEFIISITSSVIKHTYKNKLLISGFALNNVEIRNLNRKWWIDKISELIENGIKMGVFRKVDVGMVSYSIWCYCRGFNACTVGDGLTIDEAMVVFRSGFECIIRGLKAEKNMEAQI